MRVVLSAPDGHVRLAQHLYRGRPVRKRVDASAHRGGLVRWPGGGVPLALAGVERRAGSHTSHPAWSPDDQRIFFHRPTPGRGNQLYWVAADGTTEQLLVPSDAPTGSTLFSDVGRLRVKTDK